MVAPSTPCWSSACHIAPVVSPAQATKSRSAPAFFAFRANGVKSVAVVGTMIELTSAPAPPSTALTAASLAWPNA